MQSVQNNMLAMNANRQLNINQRQKAKSTEHLASGYRINRAADDAAGLAISEKMRSQIRGLNRASQNIHEGISYVQTADGALNEVHAMLQRMRELSVQSANGTNTPEDRLFLDDEVQQLKEEIDSIFEDTEFNEKKIWVADPEIVGTIVGTQEVVAVTSTYSNASTKITNYNKEMVPKTPYTLSADEKGIRVSWKSYGGETYETEVIPWEKNLAGTHSFNLKDHYGNYPELETSGLNFTYTYTVQEGATLKDVIKAIDGVDLYTTVSTPEYVQEFGTASRLSFSTGLHYEALIVSGRDFDNTAGSSYASSENVYIEAANSAGAKDQNNITATPMNGSESTPFEFTFTMPGVGKVTARATSTYYRAAVNDTNKGANTTNDWCYSRVVNGQTRNYVSNYSVSPNGTLEAIKKAITEENPNRSPSRLIDTAGTGTIELNFNLNQADGYQTADGSTMNSVGSLTMYISLRENDTVDDIVNDLKLLTGIDIYSTGSSSSYVYSLERSNHKIEVPSYEYEYDYVHQVDIQAGANEGQIIPLRYDLLNCRLLNIENTSIDTPENCGLALIAIDKAIKKISEQRSLFGAYQNRLEHAALIDDNTSENLQAAESKIRDADMAYELLVDAKYNILTQTSQAMLSQANHSMDSIVNLLQQ